ncbi:hypothetical protein EHF33_05115 [Deinococcus psychrotolerans]|uniref:Uncharacterized protein n=1 Tax=Deinococcus psychrotolerans TaxID=2489213 RepID=A0A3G8YBB3_9DEIO|nr:hypothetical protein [Deinococcus psychrotolerans]AZI42203.1 hypothetical protein EHF33_05115 [Deinococcus psychrotolerans]
MYNFRFSRLALPLTLVLVSTAAASTPQPSGQLLAQSAGANTPDQTSKPQTPLTQAELSKFLAVRSAERQALGESFSSLQNLWQGIKDGNTPSFLQVTGALRELGGSVGDAKAAQKAALTKQNLSRERFDAVRSQVNRALGVPGVEFDKLFSQLRSGDLSNLGSTVNTDTDPQTKALIEPKRTDLLETAALGLLGL